MAHLPLAPVCVFPAQGKSGNSTLAFPGRSLEALNGLQKALVRRVFSDYSSAGWEWISIETATFLLRTILLASMFVPEIWLGFLSRQRQKETSAPSCPPVILFSPGLRLAS